MSNLNEAHKGVSGQDEAPAGYQPGSGDRAWPGVLIIICLTLVAYSSVFSAGYIWDDDAYVTGNQCLRSLEGLYRIWFEPGATPQYYPLVFTFLWVQYHLWGLNPFGYHLVNILLHIGNALLLWACLRRIKAPAAFWVALLFALHPMQVESVAWITELKNVLALFFYLLSLTVYLDYAGSPPGSKLRWCYAASLLLFLCALFSKTVSGSLPAVILLILWWQHGSVRRKDVTGLLPFFALAVILGRQTARLEVSHVLARGAEWDLSFIDRVLIAGRAVWFYAGKLVWPHPLIFNYPRWTIDPGQVWQYIFPLALILALIVLWCLRTTLGRGPLAAALFFVGTLFPALGFFNVYPMRFSFVADHFQYSAGIGVIMLVCGAIGLVRNRLPAHLTAARPLFFSTVVLALTLVTWQQGRIYRDNLTLFSDTIGKNPTSWFSYANRAAEYVSMGREDLAIPDLETALRLKPDEADSLHTRGILYLKERNFEKAFENFDKSVAIRPWRVDYIKNRSNAYKFAGRLDRALVDADRVVAMEPENAGSYLHRAALYALQAEDGRTLNDLNTALMLSPEDFQAYAARGLLYYRQGQLPRAIRDYDMALKLMPDSAEVYANRGLAHAASGSVVQARSDLLKARKLGYRIDDAEVERIISASGKTSQPH